MNMLLAASTTSDTGFFILLGILFLFGLCVAIGASKAKIDDK